METVWLFILILGVAFFLYGKIKEVEKKIQETSEKSDAQCMSMYNGIVRMIDEIEQKVSK